MIRSDFRACMLLGTLSVLAACAPVAVKPVPKQPANPTVSTNIPAPVAAAPTPRYTRVEFSQLPGWQADTLSSGWPAFLGGCAALRLRADWQQVCERALAHPDRDEVAVRSFFETEFEPWRIQTDDDQGQATDSGLITGYYEPILRGSRQRGGPFTTPLYAVPDDLLSIEIAEVYPQLKGERVRGRLQGKRVVPYYDRATLDTNPAVRGKEIVWVDDPVDAFFLQIQGSGRVQLPGGEMLRLAYADQNGRPYRGIGRYLVEKGELTAEQATAFGLRSWLAEHPGRLHEVLNANPSVVFFREEHVEDPSIGPKGALGVPLTAGRSVAIDARQLPLGAPLFLSTTQPGGSAPLQRLVLGQDTGGAIRGVVRADLFWGLGSEAGERAGVMRQSGNLWLLWPRGRPLPPVPPPAETGGAGLQDLQVLLQNATRTTRRRFLVDRLVPQRLRVGTADTSELSYASLLAILRSNSLAAVPSGDTITIVPEADVRSHTLPVVKNDDPAIADDEWVTRSLVVKYLDASSLIPQLRPLVAGAGLLAAVPGANALLIVDHYGNTRRLQQVIRELDRPSGKAREVP